jgi:hypothetical protein
MSVPALDKSDVHRALPPTELMQSLRGIWKFEGEMLVVEVDQERSVLIASTYEGDPVDPRPVVLQGTQVQAFAPHRTDS